MEWASGNAGYAMTGVAKTADDYPTFQITDGKVGKCLSLVTRSTGFFGQIAGMPIAAGNLFIGSFRCEQRNEQSAESDQIRPSFPACAHLSGRLL